MPNKFVELYESTVALHERFNTSQTVQQSLERFNEEYQETLNEVPLGDLNRLSDEFVDAIVTTIGVFRSIAKSSNASANIQAMFFVMKHLHNLYLVIRKNKVSDELIEKSIDRVIQKNNAKTLETHELDKATGKIKRLTKEIS